ncbi:unnamed protein product [Trichogramma brassicae]|uniref:Uncharacterized protein n=1 Tax=Trichogramma brassicae TaxID=86971 RepID=A0A6H5IBP4_9HYME|nr:unnamed protein product [Trichogramma brassicae]
MKCRKYVYGLYRVNCPPSKKLNKNEINFSIGYQGNPKKCWSKSMTRSWGGLLVKINLIFLDYHDHVACQHCARNTDRK